MITKAPSKERKGKKMKKVILTVVAVLSMTTAFAGNEPINGQGNNTSVYELNVNMNQLARTLSLTEGQKYEVQGIMDTFAKELKEAGESEDLYRSMRVKEAINKDVKNMRRVLNKKQMRTFLNVLNSTVANRGLLK